MFYLRQRKNVVSYSPTTFYSILKVVPPVLIGVSAPFVIYLKKSCKCLTFKLGIWNFHFFFIYSNQSGTVKLFYLCFTPSSRRNPTKNNINN